MECIYLGDCLRRKGRVVGEEIGGRDEEGGKGGRGGEGEGEEEEEGGRRRRRRTRRGKRRRRRRRRMKRGRKTPASSFQLSSLNLIRHRSTWSNYQQKYNVPHSTTPYSSAYSPRLKAPATSLNLSSSV